MPTHGDGQSATAAGDARSVSKTMHPCLNDWISARNCRLRLGRRRKIPHGLADTRDASCTDIGNCEESFSYPMFRDL